MRPCRSGVLVDVLGALTWRPCASWESAVVAWSRRAGVARQTIRQQSRSARDPQPLGVCLRSTTRDGGRARGRETPSVRSQTRDATTSDESSGSRSAMPSQPWKSAARDLCRRQPWSAAILAAARRRLAGCACTCGWERASRGLPRRTCARRISSAPHTRASHGEARESPMTIAIDPTCCSTNAAMQERRAGRRLWGSDVAALCELGVCGARVVAPSLSGRQPPAPGRRRSCLRGERVSLGTAKDVTHPCQ
jgi:hypothetical protein